MKKYTHMSLFSGIGGLDLAAEWAGFTTVGQCEWADYPTKVLEKHWPDVPRWRDIRTLNAEDFYETTGLRTVDILSGGFPCQPFSVAGKQKGKGDDRYLWPEMLRVVRELKPRWVVGENVPGILRSAAADVVKDLERAGYDVVVFDFEAAAVGAPHRRERIAFVGNAKHDGALADQITRGAGTAGKWCEERTQSACKSEGTGGRADGEVVANANRERLQGIEQHAASSQSFSRKAQPRKATCECGEAICNAAGAGLQNRDAGKIYRSETFLRPQRPDWWAAEPRLGRMVDGFPRWLDEPAGIPRVTTKKKNRVGRLKCLGNAVVPQQFFPIFKAIMEMEKGFENDQ